MKLFEWFMVIRFMCHKLQVIYTTALSIFFRVASLAPILVILKYMGQIEGYQTLDYYKNIPVDNSFGMCCIIQL